MSKWLYDPKTDSWNGKEFTYNLPIHENDMLFNGFTYREIMDLVIANCGHDVTEAHINKEIIKLMELRTEEMRENLMICRENMLKEIRRV